jgi:hypothetical protein
MPVSTRIALATCPEIPDLDPDDQPLIGHFAQVGVEATPAIWSNPAVDWNCFDLVIIRNTWDYTDHLPTFLSWVQSLGSTVRNSAEIISWSSNKIYLHDLVGAGIPVIDTQFVSDLQQTWIVPPAADYVVKPSMSAGSRDTLRLSTSDSGSVQTAQNLIDQIVAAGKKAMIQPYLDRVDTDGETALLYIDGQYSHAIRKGPLLHKDIEIERVHGLYLEEDITARLPRADQRKLADRVMGYVAKRFDAPLYARIDLVDNQAGEPVVLEVEAVEPSMFFGTQPTSYEWFVQVSLS